MENNMNNLIQSCKDQNIDQVKVILNNQNFKINDNYYETINITCDLKNLEILNLLLNKLPINLLKIQQEVFNIIIKKNWPEGFKLLMKNYINNQNEVLIENKDVLEYEIKIGNIEIIDELLNYIIFNNKLNKYGENEILIDIIEKIIKYAIRYNQKEILIKLFQSYKPKIKIGVINEFINLKDDNDEILSIILTYVSYDLNYLFKMCVETYKTKCIKLLLLKKGIIEHLCNYSNDNRELNKFFIKYITELKKEIELKTKEDSDFTHKAYDKLKELEETILEKELEIKKLKLEIEKLQIK